MAFLVLTFGTQDPLVGILQKLRRGTGDVQKTSLRLGFKWRSLCVSHQEVHSNKGVMQVLRR